MKIPQLPPQLKPAIVHLAVAANTGRIVDSGAGAVRLGSEFGTTGGRYAILCGAEKAEHFSVEPSACTCEHCHAQPEFVERFAKEKSIGTETARKFLQDAGIKVHVPDEAA